MPDESIQLIITSPPYNIGKEYESKRLLNDYYDFQESVIDKCVEKLASSGSICWQVGNFVDNSSIVPLDIFLYPIFQKHGLKLRNRIVWRFRHGLHASKRFSGRYETILWFTKSDNYVFNLDDVRVPQRYPAKKHFKGEKRGKYSGNPLGMNPSDVWEPEERGTDFWDIPNVKANHREKTSHPAQFPIALVERLIQALSNEEDLVFDPFLGSGTTVAAALLHNRRGAGAEIFREYVDISIERAQRALDGSLPRRPDNPVYQPPPNRGLTRNPFDTKQKSLFDEGR